MKIQRRSVRAEVPSMAMGDIAFNLLIFFVILAKATDDSHLIWTPPQIEEVEISRFSRVSIVIDVEKETYLNGQKIGVMILENRIKQALDGVTGEDRVVQLKIHDKTPVNIINSVVGAISKARADFFIVSDKKKKKQSGG